MFGAASNATASARAAKKPVPKKRVPAEERREDILKVAAEVVGREGMHAASTAEIAKLSGISHAYLFRLFPTKEELLIAVALENGSLMRREMVEAGETAKAHGEEPLVAMGERWMSLLEDKTMLQVMLQSISGSANMPALAEQLRGQWEVLISDMERVTGAGPDEMRAFIAQGMLLLVISGLGAKESTWVERLHGGPLPCKPENLLGAPIEMTAQREAREAREAGERRAQD